jgi:hypothetical protein
MISNTHDHTVKDRNIISFNRGRKDVKNLTVFEDKVGRNLTSRSKDSFFKDSSIQHHGKILCQKP